MTTTSPKFCKDCAHFLGERVKFYECAAPVVVSTDLVTGEYNRSICRRLREKDGPCGPEGKLFKARKSLSAFDFQGLRYEFGSTLRDLAEGSPLVIYAARGAGKTLSATLLAVYFGKTSVIDDFTVDQISALTPHTLALTSEDAFEWQDKFGIALTLDAALKLISNEIRYRFKTTIPIRSSSRSPSHSAGN